MKISSIQNKYITNTLRKNNNQNIKNTVLKYDTFQKSHTYKGLDDDIFEQDGWIKFGFDGYDLSDEKNRIRYRLLSGTREGDILMKEDTSTVIIPIQNEQYKPLEKTFLNKKGNRVNPFTNIEDAPDLNGIRGKTPLSKASKKGIEKRLDCIKECGITSIIDLRDKKICKQETIDLVAQNGLNYFNLPIERISDGKCDIGFLDTITQFFDIINKGNFFIGCANGESRTDLALGINFVCNKEAKNVPVLKWLHTGNNDMNLKNNIKIINKIISKQPDYVKNWGWQDYEEYEKESMERLKNVYRFNKRKK